MDTWHESWPTFPVTPHMTPSTFWAEVVKQWNAVPNEKVAELLDSVPKRCLECLERGGRQTHY